MKRRNLGTKEKSPYTQKPGPGAPTALGPKTKREKKDEKDIRIKETCRQPSNVKKKTKKKEAGTCFYHQAV